MSCSALWLLRTAPCYSPVLDSWVAQHGKSMGASIAEKLVFSRYIIRRWMENRSKIFSRVSVCKYLRWPSQPRYAPNNGALTSSITSILKHRCIVAYCCEYDGGGVYWAGSNPSWLFMSAVKSRSGRLRGRLKGLREEKHIDKCNMSYKGESYMKGSARIDRLPAELCRLWVVERKQQEVLI